jgi:uncharacterized protein (DUF1810 family)
MILIAGTTGGAGRPVIDRLPQCSGPAVAARGLQCDHATMDDPYDLQRFVDAQDPMFDEVVAELTAGAKRSHWMWFVFPQLRGLGRSATARHYGLGSLDEARAYGRHPLLGPRLLHCGELLQALPAGAMGSVFGAVDEMKLRSCLTLFERALPEQPIFAALLQRHFGGRPDEATLALLAQGPGA